MCTKTQLTSFLLPHVPVHAPVVAACLFLYSTGALARHQCTPVLAWERVLMCQVADRLVGSVRSSSTIGVMGPCGSLTPATLAASTSSQRTVPSLPVWWPSLITPRLSVVGAPSSLVRRCNTPVFKIQNLEVKPVLAQSDRSHR